MSDGDRVNRWNRAGLKRFRYIDGNAATYFDKLLDALESSFQQGEAASNPRWKQLRDGRPISSDQATGGEREALIVERNRQLLSQYRQQTKDWGREIARVFSRSAHILSEYTDAYANEGYIGTATQWDNVRKLVETIAYHPAPPASASAKVALILKDGAEGVVEAGVQMSHKPQGGGAPVVFETLRDLECSAEANCLQIEHYNVSQESYGAGTNEFVLEEKDEEISCGDIGVLVSGSDGDAVTIGETDGKRLRLNPAYDSGKPLCDLKLLLDPDFVMTPWIDGITLSQDHGLQAGDAVAWHDGAHWKAAFVKEVAGRQIRLSSAASPGTSKTIFRLLTATGGGSVELPPQIGAGNKVWNGISSSLSNNAVDNTYGSPPNDYSRKEVSGLDICYYLPVGSQAVAEVTAVPDAGGTVLTFDGDSGGLASGQWLLCERSDDSYQSVKIASITSSEKDFSVTLSGSVAADIRTVFGDFKKTLRPKGYNRNERMLPLDPENPSDLVLEKRPAVIRRGRELLLVCGEKSRCVKVRSISGERTVVLSEPFDFEGFVAADTLVYANVVTAGHGERKPEKILGSGDASISNQSFLLKVDSVSFVEDASQASGVAAAIDVRVDGRTWEQVSSLNRSGPEDHHYCVRITEDDHLLIRFGDGVHGRRLPSGNNNVRAGYRQGVGLSGIVPANAFEKLMKKHPLAKSVVQPIKATGGNDKESVSNLKEFAPASVLTIERAVSLRDFANLAVSHSSVWQAHAFAEQALDYQSECVGVVIVPAGGGELGNLHDVIIDYLKKHAVPGVRVNLYGYLQVSPELKITARVVSGAYDFEEVEAQIRYALHEGLSLRSRRLGQHLYLSEVYSIVESVTGVENSRCEIDGDSMLRVKRCPDQRTVICLNDTDVPEVKVEPYEP